MNRFEHIELLDEVLGAIETFPDKNPTEAEIDIAGINGALIESAYYLADIPGNDITVFPDGSIEENE